MQTAENVILPPEICLMSDFGCGNHFGKTMIGSQAASTPASQAARQPGRAKAREPEPEPDPERARGQRPEPQPQPLPEPEARATARTQNDGFGQQHVERSSV